MRILKVLAVGLKAEGFGGLVSGDACGCLVDDLSPCGCLHSDCQPGYKHTHSVTGDWIISTQKEGVTDADIEQSTIDCN